MPYLEVDDTRLFYTIAGTGPDLVLVHGFTCDSTDWSWMLPRLTREFRVIAYDRRGEGRSAAAADYRLTRQVDDLVHVIDRLGQGIPVVVGHSVGTVVASVLAVEQPQLARAIAVLDPSYAHERAMAPAFDALGAALAGERPHAALAEFWTSNCFVASTPDWLPVLTTRRIDALDPAMLSAVFTDLSSHPTQLRPEADEYLARRTIPVLAIHTVRELSSMERATFQDRRSRAIDWPGMGHWFHIEHPHLTADVLCQWVASLD